MRPDHTFLLPQLLLAARSGYDIAFWAHLLHRSNLYHDVRRMQIKYSIMAIGAAALLAGCSIGNVLTPYKLQIPQGNEISADQVALLKPGMTRAQVRFVLGTPLLTDVFHANRWDYVFTEAKGGKLEIKRTFIVEFDGDKALSWHGDTMPATKLIKLGGDASAPALLDDPATAAASASSTPITQVASDTAAAAAAK